jgi:hypothetical protein
MFRFFTLLFLFVGLVTAAILEPKEFLLEQSHGSYGVIKTDQKLQVGASGIVWQNVSEGISSIVARAIVSKKVEGGYEVAYRLFDDLSQDALPYPSLEPKSGDRVILNHLYDRIIPIVGSIDALKVAQKKYDNLEFLNPELFAVFLMKENATVPNKTDFKNFCKKSNAGLIYFGLDDGGRFVDCHSFVTIAKDRVMYGVQNPQEPFYSRIRKVEKNTFESIFDSIVSLEIPFINEPETPQEARRSRLGNFYGYYKSLIRR